MNFSPGPALSSQKNIILKCSEQNEPPTDLSLLSEYISLIAQGDISTFIEGDEAQRSLN